MEKKSENEEKNEEKAEAAGSVYDEEGNVFLNPNSLTVVKAYLEPAFAGSKPYDRFQFVRQGFFSVDPKDSKEDALVFNRIVSLKSSFVLPK